MTTPGADGPPFDLDVLADLHAGVYPPDVAADLRARVAADPEASAVLAALDATVADLQDLPPIPIPPEVAARLDAAIAAEAAHEAPVVSLDGARDARRLGAPRPSTPRPSTPREAASDRLAAGAPRRNRWTKGLLLAAAVAAVVTVGTVALNGMRGGGSETAGGPPGSAAVTTAATAGMSGGAAASVTSGAPLQAVVAQPSHLGDLISQIDEATPRGPYADPARLAACLAANDATADTVRGVLPVDYTGRSAYAISLRTATGSTRILVVGPDCGASGADLMEQQTTTG